MYLDSQHDLEAIRLSIRHMETFYDQAQNFVLPPEIAYDLNVALINYAPAPAPPQPPVDFAQLYAPFLVAPQHALQNVPQHALQDAPQDAPQIIPQNAPQDALQDVPQNAPQPQFVQNHSPAHPAMVVNLGVDDSDSDDEAPPEAEKYPLDGNAVKALESLGLAEGRDFILEPDPDVQLRTLQFGHWTVLGIWCWLYPQASS